VSPSLEVLFHLTRSQFNDKFVKKLAWIDDQIFKELFSISQSLSGPASTKMLYCINLIRDGVWAAVLSFIFWSLPGAIGMFALSIGVHNIDETLPRPVYALLSGLNSATVGIIALAAVELSEKAITDQMSRFVVFFSAAAGMLYTSLWYFPVLMIISGLATLVFDYRWIHRPLAKVVNAVKGLRPNKKEKLANPEAPPESQTSTPPQEEKNPSSKGQPTVQPATPPVSDVPVAETEAVTKASSAESEPRVVPSSNQLTLPTSLTWKTGTAIIVTFFITFIVATTLRGVLSDQPLLYRLFANMYLAGTIIFGGGPVVIPLLREYVVAEGWVSPRDFLIGLAIIQAFPGPNFNFAVFLGSLTALNGGYNPLAGAFIAWAGIFAPGMLLVHGTMGIWSAIRNIKWVKSVLRGVNAGAVGLIYTAVYRIFLVGYIDEGFQAGRSLADDPWWVVITATAYVGGRYFKISAPLAILLGAVMGLLRYAVVHAGKD
jgi:chromate transport protein ChrA